MADAPFNIDSLDDAVFGTDFDQADDEQDPSNTPAGEEPAEEDDEDELPEVEIPQPAAAKPQAKDDGPGDLRVALKQERQNRQQLQQQFNQLQQQLNQITERDRAAADAARIQQEVSQLDPADVPAYLQAQQRQAAQQAQAQAQQHQMLRHVAASEELARDVLPDYDTQVNKILAMPWGNDVARWAATQPNPAKALYDEAKKIASPEELQAQVKAGVGAELENLTKARSARPTQPPAPRVGSLPAAGKSAPSDPLKGVKRGLASQVGSEGWNGAIDKLFDLAHRG